MVNFHEHFSVILFGFLAVFTTADLFILLNFFPHLVSSLSSLVSFPGVSFSTASLNIDIYLNIDITDLSSASSLL